MYIYIFIYICKEMERKKKITPPYKKFRKKSLPYIRI